MEAKDDRNRSTDRIKRLAATKVAPENSDIDLSAKFTCKKNSGTIVLPARNQHSNKTPKHNGSFHYCVLCKKAGMPEQK